MQSAAIRTTFGVAKPTKVRGALPGAAPMPFDGRGRLFVVRESPPLPRACRAPASLVTRAAVEFYGPDRGKTGCSSKRAGCHAQQRGGSHRGSRSSEITSDTAASGAYGQAPPAPQLRPLQHATPGTVGHPGAEPLPPPIFTLLSLPQLHMHLFPVT